MVCQGCKKTPLELPEFWDLCREGPEDPQPTAQQILDAAWSEEGTMNRENGHFLCNMCYIKAGMPTSPTGWKCP
jgi:hypothetical protein